MAMTNGLLKGIAAAAAVAGFLTLGFDASAQDTKKAPAAKKAASAPKAKSACQGLDQAACTANTTCQWIAATKTKAGKERKAYCRTRPAAKKK